MTHASNILIPARFVFRPFRVRWEMTWATIVGWGEVPFPRLTALANRGEWVFNPESVVIRVALQSQEPQGTSAMLLGLAEHDFYDVEVSRNDIPADCLLAHENPTNAPDIAGREFDVLACRLPNTDMLGPSIQPGESLRNAWDMREEFFNLENDAYPMREFLNRWGLWSFERHYQSGTLKSHPIVIVSTYRLWSLRDRYMKAAAGSPRAWLGTATPLSFKETPKAPYFMVERHFCDDAIQATLTIDHLSNVRFGICKLPDCRKLFKRKTAQKQLYCGPQHAHLANVRKLRAIKAKLKGKKNAKG